MTRSAIQLVPLALLLTVLPAAAVEKDVSHVKKGQKYYYESSQEAGMAMTHTKSVWTITAVKPGEYVEYDASMVTTIKLKKPPAGMPPMPPRKTEMKGQKMPLTTMDPGAPAPGAPKVEVKKLGKATIKVSGVTFDCQITEVKGIKSWTSNKYPFTIKSERGGKPFHTLVKIDLAGANPGSGGGADPGGAKPGGAKPAGSGSGENIAVKGFSFVISKVGPMGPPGWTTFKVVGKPHRGTKRRIVYGSVNLKAGGKQVGKGTVYFELPPAGAEHKLHIKHKSADGKEVVFDSFSGKLNVVGPPLE